MAEEQIKPDETPEVPETPETPETDPLELKAREMGWRGKEEWDGPEEDFIDAREFVRRQPLFDKIDLLNKELKKIKQGHEALVDHTKKLKEAEFKRAIEQLKDARKTAIIEGEGERALAYEEKLEEVEKMQSEFEDATNQLKQTTQSSEEHPFFVSWKNRNSWYGRDRAMTAFADQLGRDLHVQGKTPNDILDEVAKEVKKEFSHKFVNPNREKPAAVETPTRKSKASADFQLPPEDAVVMNKILRAGGITKDEYIAQYKLIHGVK